MVTSILWRTVLVQQNFFGDRKDTLWKAGQWRCLQAAGRRPCSAGILGGTHTLLVVESRRRFRTTHLCHHYIGQGHFMDQSTEALGSLWLLFLKLVLLFLCSSPSVFSPASLDSFVIVAWLFQPVLVLLSSWLTFLFGSAWLLQPSPVLVFPRGLLILWNH